MTFRFFSLLILFTLHSPLYTLAGGSLFVQKITTNDSAISSANVLYFDNKGAIRPITPEDIEIMDGVSTARILDVKCPPERPVQHVSSVLTIDVSGSMRFGGPNITLARAAAQAWVEALTDSSDCALTTFDDQAMIISDFTQDKIELTQKIQTILPHGGTSYEQGLLDSDDGGISIAAKGTKRRVLVFLTDGQGHVDAQRVISEAQRNNITVYCVSLGMHMPSVLRKVSEGSGGLWFDNVTTVEQAILAYRRIFAHASGATGCLVRWQAMPTCDGQKVVKLRVKDATFTETVSVPDNFRGGCTFTPNVVSFTNDSSRTAEVVIAARALPVTIKSVRIDRSDAFSIDAGQLPRTLKRGESLRLKITRNTVDTFYTVGKIIFESDPCPLPDFYLAAGDPNRKPARSTLRVVHPNGGERFLARSVVPLKWEGLPPSVPVRLEISTDGGFLWSTVQESAVGNIASWRSIKTPTDSCLLRVTHIKERKDSLKPILVIPGGKFHRVEFSPDGKYIATAEYFGARGTRERPPSVKLWDSYTGQLIKEFGTGERLMFDPTSSLLLAWDHRHVEMFDVASGATRWTKSHGGGLVTCEFDSTGKRLLLACSTPDTSRVVDAGTGQVIEAFPRIGQTTNWGTISRDGKRVAMCYYDSLVSIHELGKPTPLTFYENGSRSTYRVAFSPDGSMLGMTSNNGTATLWDVKSGTRRYEVTRRGYVNDNTYVSFSPDGRRVAVEYNTDMTAVFDAVTGKRVVSMRRLSDVGGASAAGFLQNGGLMYITTLTAVSVLNAYTGVMTARLPRGEGEPTAPADGERIAVVDRDLNISVYPLKEPLLQQDVSDALWSLYIPTGTMKDVQFADRFVGQAQDTVVNAAITNTSRDTLVVTSLRLEGGTPQDFSIASPSEIIIPPFATANVQYTFHPHSPGEKQSTIVAATNGGRLTAIVKGNSPKSVFRTASNDIDLGVHPVGITTHVSSDSAITNVSDKLIQIASIRMLSSSDSSLSMDDIGSFALAPTEKKPIPFEFSPTEKGRVTARLAITLENNPDPLFVNVIIRADSMDIPQQLKDPTTFRAIMLPTAVIPKQGTITFGVYDFLGLQAGYSVTDNVMILAGGTIPLPNRWFGATGYDASWSTAWSLGAKCGFELDSNIIVGGGYQFGQSYYDQDYSEQLESKITFNALWATAGYGDDDSRLNVYVGYAFKHHETFLDGSFDADAVITGIGYDYRIAEHWKICGEAFFMRTMSFVPITLTARYFREFDAFELGLSYVGIAASGAQQADIPVLPMLTWVRRF